MSKREEQRLRKMAKIRVADIPLRVRPAPNVRHLARWMDELDQYQQAYWNNDPLRPGATYLTAMQSRIKDVRAAIQSSDAPQAAWAGMALVHAEWLAFYTGIEPILRRGFEAGKTHRKNLTEANAEREAEANARVAKPFQIWRTKLYKNNRHLSLEQIARRYHKSKSESGQPVADRDKRRLYGLIREGELT